jgi:hypothetical protein
MCFKSAVCEVNDNILISQFLWAIAHLGPVSLESVVANHSWIIKTTSKTCIGGRSEPWSLVFLKIWRRDGMINILRIWISICRSSQRRNVDFGLLKRLASANLEIESPHFSVWDHYVRDRICLSACGAMMQKTFLIIVNHRDSGTDQI